MDSSLVNTFLPYPDFIQSAQSLDSRRLGKQRVEALQILRANLGLAKGWANHPAAVMWRGHENALIAYGIAMCDEWVKRGYVDNCKGQFMELYKVHNSPKPKHTKGPWWLDNEEFHESHQSNLVRKDSNHYAFKVSNDLPYKWPVMDGSYTFRTIKKKGEEDDKI